MEESISQVKAGLLRVKQQMAHALATTPDDRINWSPSPTARTPVQQVAHGAGAISGIQGMLTGRPFPYANSVEFDAAVRAAEKEFTTRDQALGLLEQTCAEYLNWLDTLTPEQLASPVRLPFGPPLPLAVGITLPADHLSVHVAQMNYIQTVYGDRDWHIDG